MATSQLPQLPAEPHVALVRCQTNYLGYSAPSAVRDGLEAVQKPLAQLVCAAGRVLGPPFDAILTAYTSGVTLEAPPNAVRPVVINKWFPICDLLECGAFRWDGTMFQPIKFLSSNPVIGGQPTLFAMTFRRRDIPANDCWGFVTKTEQAAIALVAALKLAHMNRLGWASSPTDSPPSMSPGLAFPGSVQRSASKDSSIFQASNGCGRSSCWSTTEDDCGTFINSRLGNFGQIYNEFNEKPPLQGYFYTPSSSLIKTYSVASEKSCYLAPEQQIQRSTEPKLSAAPLISGPFGPDYTRMDRYYDGPSAAGVQGDFVVPTKSWPLVQDAPLNPQQQPQQQALPVPFAEYPVVSYPEYFPAYPPQFPPPIQQPETVEVITRVVKKKHHKPSYDDDDDCSTVSSGGRNGGRYVLVPESALQGRERRRPLREVTASQPMYPTPEFIPSDLIPRDDYLQQAYYPQYESYIAPGIPPPGPVDPLFQGPPPLVDPYADEGPYERRLPIGGPQMAGKMVGAYDDSAYDPNMMYGSNFILRPTDGMMRRA